MTKTLRILSISVLLFAASSCGNKQETTTLTTDSLATTNGAIEEVASDKEKLRQAIILASQRDTLDDALAEAAQDSVVLDHIRAALVLVAGSERTASTSSTTTSGKKSTSTSTATKTPAQKKDALDQANDALDKTNRTIDRTNETVNKANEAAKKADELLRRK